MRNKKMNILQVTSVPLRSCQLNNMGMSSLCQSEDNAKVVQIKICLFTNCLKRKFNRCNTCLNRTDRKLGH